MTALATELVIGEDRVLTLDLKESDGTTALVVTGWALELRLGSNGTTRLTKTLAIDGAVAGRVSCVFMPTELAAVGPGNAQAYAVWRTDTGATWLLAYGTVTVLKVI
jgi:hypothetical protein